VWLLIKLLFVFGARRILARPGGLYATQHSAQYAEHGPDREREREGGNRNRHLGRGLLARSRQGIAAARLVTTHASAVSGAIDEGESAGRSKGPRLSEPPRLSGPRPRVPLLHGYRCQRGRRGRQRPVEARVGGGVRAQERGGDDVARGAVHRAQSRRAQRSRTRSAFEAHTEVLLGRVTAAGAFQRRSPP
jgi:hypothetical protein